VKYRLVGDLDTHIFPQLTSIRSAIPSNVGGRCMSPRLNGRHYLAIIA
jgi:hypothetical protein